MTQGTIRVGLALLILGLAVVAPAFADEPLAPTTPADSSASDRITSSRVTVVDGSLDQALALASGMIVAIDPATGERRAPTDAEAADLTAAARFQARHPEGADLQQFAVRSGGTGVLLDSRYLTSETVELRLDGSLSAGHQTGVVESLGFLQPALAVDETAGDDETSDETASDAEVQP